ncbi:hypothetical protein [Vibrio owensii]|uniref:hypothetical protein n=1 Tax=Vibrio owensii TaxID=696485 RepID=UPI0018F16C5A|nr:hypothetical protein [Vibrio owensii]
MIRSVVAGLIMLVALTVFVVALVTGRASVGELAVGMFALSFVCGFIAYGFSVFTRVLSGIASAILLVLEIIHHFSPWHEKPESHSAISWGAFVVSVEFALFIALGFQDIVSGLILGISSFFFVVINWYLIRAMVLQGRTEA